VDILRSVNVEIRIDEKNVEVSQPGRSWRLDDANRIVIGEDAHGRRVILGIGAPRGIGDRTDAAVSEQGGQLSRAFDAASFDPDVSTSATRWWSYRGVTAGARHETFAFVFTRTVLHIFWPAWDAIPFEARRRYLNLVASWADVVMNGHRAATWPLSRRLMRQPPQVFE
jgi:hypothetical protein